MLMEVIKVAQDETRSGLGSSQEKRQAALNRQTQIRLTELSQMPVCPNCGENTPDMLSCPFCEDMSEQAAGEPAEPFIVFLIDGVFVEAAQ